MNTSTGDKILVATAGAVGAFAGLLSGLLLPDQYSADLEVCRDTSTAAVASLNAYDDYLSEVLDAQKKGGRVDPSKVKRWEQDLDKYNNALWELYPKCAK